MNQGPSREEFKAFVDRVYQQMDDGFSGVHERLDTLNGRTGKGEVERENLRTRIVSLEKETFSEPRRRVTDVISAPPPPSFFSKREGALVTLGVAAVATLLKLLLLSGQFVFELVKAAVKR